MTITGFEQDAITRRVVGQSWYIEYEPEFSDRTPLARKQSYQSDWCARRRLLLFFRVHQKSRCANTGCSSQHINVESICVHHNVILHSHRTASQYAAPAPAREHAEYVQFFGGDTQVLNVDLVVENGLSHQFR
jgi:hypothetical protein